MQLTSSQIQNIFTDDNAGDNLGRDFGTTQSIQFIQHWLFLSVSANRTKY
jgi:hypothetical protein